MLSVSFERAVAETSGHRLESTVAESCGPEIWLDDPRLTDVTLRVFESHVELTGSVTSFGRKQLAQEILRPDVNPRQIINRVQVVR